MDSRPRVLNMRQTLSSAPSLHFHETSRPGQDGTIYIVFNPFLLASVDLFYGHFLPCVVYRIYFATAPRTPITGLLKSAHHSSVTFDGYCDGSTK
jgi:hypothetical protein